MQSKERAALVSGFFYPEKPEELGWYLQAYGLVKSSAAAILVPHGDWNIFGAAAAAGFGAALGRESGGLNTPESGIRRVLLMGCLHESRDWGVFLSNSRRFQTPLGEISVDLPSVYALNRRGKPFEINEIHHLDESVLETQLPFIRHCFPRAALVPLLMGVEKSDASAVQSSSLGELINVFAEALWETFKDKMGETLPIICSNLPSDLDEGRARERADTAIRLLEANDVAAYTDSVLEGQSDMCAGPLIAALLKSGLVNKFHARLIPGTYAKARDSEGRIGFYASFAWV